MEEVDIEIDKIDYKNKTGYTAVEIQALEARAYVRGRADENKNTRELLLELLEEAEEKYKTYKKGVDENESLKFGMWKHLGEIQVLKKLLGIPENMATLDKFGNIVFRKGDK